MKSIPIAVIFIGLSGSLFPRIMCLHRRTLMHSLLPKPWLCWKIIHLLEYNYIIKDIMKKEWNDYGI